MIGTMPDRTSENRAGRAATTRLVVAKIRMNGLDGGPRPGIMRCRLKFFEIRSVEKARNRPDGFFWW